MVNSGAGIDRRRPLVERKQGGIPALLDALLEDALLSPECEDSLLE